MKTYSIAIIGAGAAGTMATLRAILNNDEVLLFPGTAKDRKKARATWVSKVENMPGYFEYKKGIDDPNKETLSWIENSVFKNNFHFLKNTGVASIKKKNNIFHLTGSDNKTYLAKFVILATGVMDVQPEINGTIKDILPYANVQLADYCLRCDGHHVLGKELSVIGHTSDAAWVAIMLYERYKCPNVSLITNGKKPEFDEQTQKLIELYKFDVKTNEIRQILGNKTEKKLEGFVLSCGSSVYSQICFISLGMIVYNDLAKQLGAELDKRGFVIGDKSGETNIKNFYVCGDVKANTKKQIYTGWDNAVDAADAINRLLRTEAREKLLNGP